MTVTDNEIIKAMELCAKGECHSSECPVFCHTKNCADCQTELIRLALDLFLRRNVKTERTEESTKETVTNVMRELGIPANISGYYYIRDAVLLVMEDITFIHSVTKKLYPTVAKCFNTKAMRVERAIRHGIETGWHRGNVDFQNKLFGYTVHQDKGAPTNSEFIATIADYINMLRN